MLIAKTKKWFYVCGPTAPQSFTERVFPWLSSMIRAGVICTEMDSTEVHTRNGSYCTYMLRK